ncbi:MAG: tripartite tricarboxylate transporter permease [Alphaproteobacteria bacterium]|nr:tripartite tricarboxylate transporter permease [Alphaproteobacteria bacterium]
MLDAAVQALFIVLQPGHLAYLLVGVGVGLAVGVLPGLGGIVGMALLLPLTFTMDATAGLAMLIGVAAVITTSDTFVSVLMGCLARPDRRQPSSTAMRWRKGRGRLRAPPPSCFHVRRHHRCVGPVPVAAGRARAGSVLCLARTADDERDGSLHDRRFVGQCTAQGHPRRLARPVPRHLGRLQHHGGIPLLLRDGLSVRWHSARGPLPRPLCDPGVSGRFVARRIDCPQGAFRRIGLGRGRPRRPSELAAGRAPFPGRCRCRDRARSRRLDRRLAQLRPAGAHRARQVEIRLRRCAGCDRPGKRQQRQGRRRADPDASFGVPGSAGMALLLSAMVVQGIQPGPRMLTDNLQLIFALVWSLAIGNVVGTAVCFALSRPISRLALVPFSLLFPVVFTLIIVGAYQSTRHFGDLLALVACGMLGWLMKRFGFPRAPLLIGFILSALVERNLWITLNRYGWDWLSRPGVLVIGVLTLLFLGYGLRAALRREKSA